MYPLAGRFSHLEEIQARIEELVEEIHYVLETEIVPFQEAASEEPTSEAETETTPTTETHDDRGHDHGEVLEQATRSSRVVVVTGAEDRLLRQLTLELDLGVEGARELEQALESLGGGATLTFDLRIERPNEPVNVDEPAEAVPYPG